MFRERTCGLRADGRSGYWLAPVYCSPRVAVDVARMRLDSVDRKIEILGNPLTPWCTVACALERAACLGWLRCDLVVGRQCLRVEIAGSAGGPRGGRLCCGSRGGGALDAVRASGGAERSRGARRVAGHLLDEARVVGSCPGRTLAAYGTAAGPSRLSMHARRRCRQIRPGRGRRGAPGRLVGCAPVREHRAEREPRRHRRHLSVRPKLGRSRLDAGRVWTGNRPCGWFRPRRGQTCFGGGPLRPQRSGALHRRPWYAGNDGSRPARRWRLASSRPPKTAGAPAKHRILSPWSASAPRSSTASWSNGLFSGFTGDGCWDTNSLTLPVQVS